MKKTLFFLFLNTYLFCNLTTTVMIPCVARHFKHLHELLNLYANQTEIPNEIVISLSDVETLNEEDVLALENAPWPFSVKIIKHIGKKSAGENRNIAAKNASGDILICQDADDIPHPQRIEIVKYIFENYEVDHLLHPWIENNVPFETYEKEKIKVTTVELFQDLAHSLRLHQGNPCLARYVVKKVKWPNGFEIAEDRRFTAQVYKAFKHKVIIDAPIYKYRWNLSSFNPEN